MLGFIYLKKIHSNLLKLERFDGIVTVSCIKQNWCFFFSRKKKLHISFTYLLHWHLFFLIISFSSIVSLVFYPSMWIFIKLLVLVLSYFDISPARTMSLYSGSSIPWDIVEWEYITRSPDFIDEGSFISCFVFSSYISCFVISSPISCFVLSLHLKIPRVWK